MAAKRKVVKKKPVKKKTTSLVVTAVTRGTIKPGMSISGMPRRAVLKRKEPNYFASNAEHKGLQFFSTGCKVLDNVFGGGYVLGRMANIVGDKSTGKTLLAIEACSNFIRSYPKGKIRYAEAEAAFDKKYAEALGMPVASVTFEKNIFTIEDFFESIEKVCKESSLAKPILYVLDSLDALSDRGEKDRDIGEGSYNLTKQKKLSELFRRKIQELESSNVCLIIISQIRDKIGVTFGETKMRTGGKAMDFYASQVIWLSEIQKLKRTIDKVDRVTGIQVRAKCKKNKIGLPFRECDFPLLFGYGIDDLTANVEWLIAMGKDNRLKELGISKAGYKIRIGNLRNNGGAEIIAFRDQLSKIVDEEWSAIETTFLPKSRKY
jgi:protein RecA